MNSQIDSSIPVLTEVITTASVEANPATTISEKSQSIEIATNNAQATAPSISSSNNAPTQAVNEIHQNDAASAPQLSEEQLQHLENKLREDILNQVSHRIEFVLEHRIRDGLADVLQSAVDDLAEQIRAGMRVSLEELVRRSVNQELSKIKLSK